MQRVLGVDKRLSGVIKVAFRPVTATSQAGAVLHANRGVADNVVAVDVALVMQTAQRAEGGLASHLEVQRRAGGLGAGTGIGTRREEAPRDF